MFETVLSAILYSIHSAPLLVFMVSAALSVVLLVLGLRCAKEKKMFLSESAVGLPWIVPLLSCSIALIFVVILVNFGIHQTPVLIAASSLLIAIPIGVVGYILRNHLPYFDYNKVLLVTTILTIVLISPFEMGFANLSDSGSASLGKHSPIIIVMYGILPSACVYALLNVFQFTPSASSETNSPPQTEINPIKNKSEIDDTVSIEKHIPKRIDYRPEE